MGVDDGVALIRTVAGLIHALGKYGDGTLAGGKPVIEGGQVYLADTHLLGQRVPIISLLTCRVQRGVETVGMGIDIILVQCVMIIQPGEQTVEQGHVLPRANGQVQIGQVTGGGAAGINDYHFHVRTRLFGGGNSLVDDGVRPGGIGTGENHQVRQLQIFIAAGHHVFAKGALMSHHRTAHAQAGIGIDVGAANKPFHQFIGHVIVFGEQLAGHIEGHRIRAVFIDNTTEPVGHFIQGAIPGNYLPIHFWLQQAILIAQGFQYRGPFHTQAPGIGRVLLVALQFDAIGFDTAAHAAVRTGGANTHAAISSCWSPPLPGRLQKASPSNRVARTALMSVWFRHRFSKKALSPTSPYNTMPTMRLSRICSRR